MVKKCKKFLITGIILIFVGLSGIIALGASGMLDNSSVEVSENGISVATSETSDITCDLDAKALADVKELDITSSAGKFNIIAGDVYDLSAVGIDPNGLKTEIKNGCLKIDYAPASVKLISFDFANEEGPEIFLTVPMQVYDKVKINIKAGEFDANALMASEMDFKISAGTATFQGAMVLDSANIEMSAGNCEFSDCILTKPDIDMYAGAMYFNSLILNGDTDLEIKAGSLDMNICGNRSDYEIKTQMTGGRVIVDGMQEYGDMGVVTTTIDDYSYSGQGPLYGSGTINIDVSAGSCNIEFIDEIDGSPTVVYHDVISEVHYEAVSE